ncbi:hypothetical protein QBC43DRAFT_273002 [Cladorrhinum sp. PSN259]|nr:hypothetical protein QBC43DRAFT_273002 [Cladorrhinum sp. PSN259]
MSSPKPTTTTTTSATSATAESSDSEDDYLKMDFSEPPPNASHHKSQPESSLARLRRLRREAEIRGRPKSKAELAAEAQSRLEAAHSQSLLSQNPKSKGLAMMAKMGFKPGKTLGKSSSENADAAKEPIKVSIKDGREGIGLESERKRKLREMAEANEELSKKAKVDEGEYRDRVRREREEARLEKLVGAAQKVAEGMGGEKLGGEGMALKGIPVVWRGLVRSREEGERTRRMRHDLEYGLAKRLPTYDDADEDEDDREALGKSNKATTYVVSEDLDEEDEELEEFDKLPVEVRLNKVVGYLREDFNYCFWCKYAYPDKEMEGCPGLTEEDHD